jgi:hypothetical protein
MTKKGRCLEAQPPTAYSRNSLRTGGLHFVAAAAALPLQSCVVDGEAIVVNREGLSVFDLLRYRYHDYAAVPCEGGWNVKPRFAEAYEEALRALHISDRNDPINQIIAQRIIEGARTGRHDPAICASWQSRT